MDGFSKLIDARWQSLVSQVMARQKEPNNDLEYLLGRLEFYQSIADEHTKDTLLRSWISANNTNLGHQAHELKWHIFDKIIKTYGFLSPQASAKAVDIYHPLFTGLLDLVQGRSVLPIFTTNYDLTFEAIRDGKLDFTICNGVATTGEIGRWSRKVYETQANYRFAIFRLHGCSHWMRQKLGGGIVFQALPDIGDAEIREPCLLYPIPGKEDRIFEEPFRTAYRHFELCLLAAKTIVIIGYSGRDPIIRAHLKEALELDPVKRIIVVTGGKQLRPELEELKASCQDFVHLPDGIEANANNLPNIVAGRVGVSLADSMRITDPSSGGTS
jgi:hypothetical protein